jgi:two-component system sensor histidine kinase HydH
MVSKRWLYGLLGAGVGVTDIVLLRVFDVVIEHNGVDVGWALMALFSVSLGGLGFAVGRLSEAKAELQTAQHELVATRSLAQMGRMAANVAHEVRNPLGVIRSSAALIAEALPPETERDATTQESAQASAFIIEEVDRLDAYVGRILRFARPLAPQRGPVGIDQVTARAARLAELPCTVQGACQPIHADEELLVRLLLGLLRNAHEAGATHVTVDLRDGDPLVVQVRDDGPGLSPEDAAHAFEPFFTTKATGTGLGLAHARRIAEAHGGTLTWDHGSAFVLTLPRDAP